MCKRVWEYVCVCARERERESEKVGDLRASGSLARAGIAAQHRVESVFAFLLEGLELEV